MKALGPRIPRWVIPLLIQLGRYLLRTLSRRSAPAPARPKKGHVTSAFTRLDRCELAGVAGADGDSFRVRHAQGVSVFRLYWVDTCEKNAEFPDRIRHQARYFSIPESEVPIFGEQAREFTLGLIQNRTFTIHTRWEPVMESERFHAFVEVDGKLLCEQLVGEGLARIYTMPADPPDGSSQESFRAGLLALERTALASRRGAWQHSSRK